MSLLSYAQRELDIIGMTENDDDEANREMRRKILEVVHTFSEQNHNSFSTDYAVSVLQNLLRCQPLSQLTGDDSEWVEVYSKEGNESFGKVFQNIRCATVFKDDRGPYDSNGRVFYQWVLHEESGEEYKDFYTTDESRVEITFPYAPVTEFIERVKPVEEPQDAE